MLSYQEFRCKLVLVEPDSEMSSRAAPSRRTVQRACQDAGERHAQRHHAPQADRDGEEAAVYAQREVGDTNERVCSESRCGNVILSYVGLTEGPAYSFSLSSAYNMDFALGVLYPAMYLRSKRKIWEGLIDGNFSFFTIFAIF